MAQIASATAAMGTLKDVWRNPHLDIYNKYLLFWAIPMNLLLWGAEMWSLRKTQLDQLKVFLHRSIRRILQISMSTVKEEIFFKMKEYVRHFIPSHAYKTWSHLGKKTSSGRWSEDPLTGHHKTWSQHAATTNNELDDHRRREKIHGWEPTLAVSRC